ncbi:MAG: hypothetical protein AAGG11_09520 [Pseudomonadota bacterium]
MTPLTTDARRAERYDDALASLRAIGPYLKNGYTNHMPMVLEALDYLDADVDLKALANDSLASATPRPPLRAAIGHADYAAALGEALRFGDWALLFADALQRDGAASVLAVWLPRLAPALASGASHGVIRTAHAVRAWERHPSDARLWELADGLAYWASSFHQPGYSRAGPEPVTGLDARQAFDALPHLAPHLRRTNGSIVAALEQLEHLSELPAALHALRIDRPDPRCILDLQMVFARAFRSAVRRPLDAVVFTHALTGVAAAEVLLPFMPEAERVALLRHAWNAGCSLFVAYGGNGQRSVGGAAPVCRETRDALLRSAVASGDDHAIKLTAVCLELAERSGDDAFLATAALGVRQLTAA